jgi:FtsH-binding integral membrane protein
METFAGIVLITGSVFFLIAAFMPISMRVFAGSDSQKQLEYIQKDRRGWLVSCVLFGAGSVVAVVGLALFALHVQAIRDNAIVKLLLWLATAGAAFGALQWVIIVYQRATLPLEKIFNNGNSNKWAFPAYTILTQIALIIVGFVLLQTGYPSWLGWGTVILAALSLLAFLVFKDMPPFTHYLIMLVIGIVLTR